MLIEFRKFAIVIAVLHVREIFSIKKKSMYCRRWILIWNFVFHNKNADELELIRFTAKSGRWNETALIHYKEKAKQCFTTKEQKFIRNARLYYNPECSDTSSKLFMREAMNAFKSRNVSIITATNFKIACQ